MLTLNVEMREKLRTHFGNGTVVVRPTYGRPEVRAADLLMVEGPNDAGIFKAIPQSGEDEGRVLEFHVNFVRLISPKEDAPVLKMSQRTRRAS